MVRGDVIRFIAFGGDEKYHVQGAVIELNGAWICGEVSLDLKNANIPYVLGFFNCHFDIAVDIIHAECAALYLNGSHLTKKLMADGLITKGNVGLRANFSSKGEVRLLGANIGGDLDCGNGKFDNPKGYTLDADQITVKGNVFLRNGFFSKGEVRLLGANIGGQLSCTGGKFHNPNKRAISADQLTVKGDALLRNNFSAKGEVRFLGADIGGRLDCAGGRFNNKGDSKYALNAERVKVGGHVYLNWHEPTGGKRSFIARGRVRFANAAIGGNFNCKGGKFLHSGKGSALAAGGLRSRAVFLSEQFSAKGEVALHVAHIGNFVCTDCVPNCKSPITINLASTESAAVDDTQKSWRPFRFILDDFSYDTFYGHSPVDSKSRLEWLAKRPEKRHLKNGDEVPLLFSPLPYDQVAKVLFGMGRASDARKILLEKERLQTADARTHPFRKFWRGLWDLFAGYGYRLRYTAYWIVGFVGLGALLFSCADYYGHMAPHQPVVLTHKDYNAAVGHAEGENKCPKSKSPTEAVACLFPDYPEFHPVVYSADVFIPFFALHQEPYWYPNPSDTDPDLSMRFLLWWYWLEIAAGWILTSLFLLSATGLLRPRQSSGGKD